MNKNVKTSRFLKCIFGKTWSGGQKQERRECLSLFLQLPQPVFTLQTSIWNPHRPKMVREREKKGEILSHCLFPKLFTEDSTVKIYSYMHVPYYMILPRASQCNQNSQMLMCLLDCTTLAADRAKQLHGSMGNSYRKRLGCPPPPKKIVFLTW